MRPPTLDPSFSRSQRTIAILHLLAGIVVGFSGCGRAPGRSVVVADSAGITITLSVPAPSAFARVEAEPVLSLGGPEDQGATQFFQIQDLYVDPQRRMWIADGQSAEVRIFLSDGSHLKTVGGRGEGPGEFQRIRLLEPILGDSVAVCDPGLARMTILDPDGDLVRTERVAPGQGPFVRCAGVFPDGSILGQVPTILPASSLEPGRVLGDSVRLVRVDPPDSTLGVWAMSDGPRWVWTGRNQVPLPFTANPGFDLLGEDLHLVSGPDFRIRVFREGAVTRIYGVDQNARRVGDRDLEAYGAFVEGFIPVDGREEYLSALDVPELPGYLPAYSDVLVSASGEVWVQVYSPDPRRPGSWHVFDGAGVWLGTVETPADLWVRQIWDAGIAGVWRDSVGVEHPRIYRLLPARGQEVSEP